MSTPAPPAIELRRCGCCDRERPAGKVTDLGNKGKRLVFERRSISSRGHHKQLRHADPCVGRVRYVAASSAAPSQLGCGRGTRRWLINDGRRAVEAKREEIEASSPT